MKLREISKPQTTEFLNQNISKLFDQKIDVSSFTVPQLEDARNKLRTAISQFETNESYDAVHSNANYHKQKMFLDVINAALAEAEKKPDDDGDGVPNWADKQQGPDPKPKPKGTKNMPPQLQKHAEKEIEEAMDKAIKEGFMDTVKNMFSSKKGSPRTKTTGQQMMANLGKTNFGLDNIMPKKTFSRKRQGGIADHLRQKYGEFDLASIQWQGTPLTEGEEDKAELVMAAKDMVDRITSWMEDTAEMQSESMLELGDAIRDELGQEQSEGFTGQVKPALESLYQALEATRGALTQGVTMLTGEGVPADTMGAEPMAPDATGDEMGMEEPGMEEPGMEPTVDAEMGDEFAAAEPAAGGLADEGREKRESIQRQIKKQKLAEHLALSTQLGRILSSKKK